MKNEKGSRVNGMRAKTRLGAPAATPGEPLPQLNRARNAAAPAQSVSRLGGRDPALRAATVSAGCGRAG